jgi:DNA gyrase subunit B
MSDSALITTRKLREMVRLRPAMYIGSTDEAGLDHLIIELFDNSVDQFLAGEASNVNVEITGNSVRVTDDGPGLPFDMQHDALGESLATQYLTNFHNSPTADGHVPHIHFDAVGCGLFVVNYLSSLMTCRSWRGTNLWEQQFVQGEPTSSPRIVATGTGRGTEIEFTPDASIFKDTMLSAERLRMQLFVAAHLIPGIVVGLQNERFQSWQGLSGLLRVTSAFSQIPGPVFSMDRNTKKFRIIAAAKGLAKEKTVAHFSWANGFYTVQGGTHATAFANALGSVRWKPAIAMIHVIMNEPQFSGTSKTKLCVEELKSAMAALIREQLKPWCQNNKVGRYAGDH